MARLKSERIKALSKQPGLVDIIENEQALDKRTKSVLSPLQNLASALLDFLSTTAAATAAAAAAAGRASVINIAATAAFFDTHSSVDGELEDLIHTAHFLTAALHVFRPHALSDGFALLRGHRGQTLGFQEFNAGTL